MNDIHSYDPCLPRSMVHHSTAWHAYLSAVTTGVYYRAYCSTRLLYKLTISVNKGCNAWKESGCVRICPEEHCQLLYGIRGSSPVASKEGEKRSHDSLEPMQVWPIHRNPSSYMFHHMLGGYISMMWIYSLIC
jgi:hypothetical protein